MCGECPRPRSPPPMAAAAAEEEEEERQAAAARRCCFSTLDTTEGRCATSLPSSSDMEQRRIEFLKNGSSQGLGDGLPDVRKSLGRVEFLTNGVHRGDGLPGTACRATACLARLDGRRPAWHGLPGDGLPGTACRATACLARPAGRRPAWHGLPGDCLPGTA
eukprot:364466-Chlamydomonas_euryale.AAC.3